MATRLNKYISDSGFCSRREADRYIEQGSVFVNGKRAKVGDQVTAKDRVIVSGNPIEAPAEEEAVYIAFNKPPGVTTTTTAGVKDNIRRAIRHSMRLVPVGQLDKDAQGLVLLSSNGEWVNRVLRSSAHENEYVVMLDKPITEPFLESIAHGNGQASAASQNIRVQKDTAYIFRITLVHDAIRQIQRWCEQLGYKVVQMERIRVMNISVKALGVGEWRELRAGELSTLQDLLQQGGKQAVASTPRRQQRTGTAAAFRAERKSSPASTSSANEWLEMPAAEQPRPRRSRAAGSPTPGNKARPAGPRGPAGAAGSARAGASRGGAKPTSSAAKATPKSRPSTRGSRGSARPGK